MYHILAIYWKGSKMTLKIPVAGLLTGLLVACSIGNSPTTVQPTPIQIPAYQIKSEVPQSPETEIAVKPRGDVKPETKKANDSRKISNSADAIGKSAKLTPAQVKELTEMEKRKAFKGLRSKERVKAKFVVPTYLPPGFKVSHFSTEYIEHLGGRYRIAYCNASKSCFLIEGGIPLPMGDEPITYQTIKTISSPALGNVELGYANYERTKNQPHISLDRFLKDNNEYTFQSSVWSIYKGLSENKAISFNEAVKIVKSLQYLNP